MQSNSTNLPQAGFLFIYKKIANSLLAIFKLRFKIL